MWPKECNDCPKNGPDGCDITGFDEVPEEKKEVCAALKDFERFLADLRGELEKRVLERRGFKDGRAEIVEAVGKSVKAVFDRRE